MDAKILLLLLLLLRKLYHRGTVLIFNTSSLIIPIFNTILSLIILHTYIYIIRLRQNLNKINHQTNLTFSLDENYFLIVDRHRLYNYIYLMDN